jgi:hypothetical protein
MHPKDVLKRIRKRQGRCYELAGMALLKADGWSLVHGEANCLPDVPGGHAWLVSGEAVYDPVLHREIPLAEYTTRYGGKECRRYSKTEAATMMMFTRKYGPWTAEEERRFLTEGQLAPATRL